MKYIPIILILIASCTADVNRTYDKRETFETNTKNPQGELRAKDTLTDSNYLKRNMVSEEIKKGRELFNAKCNSCHELNKRVTGPALANIGEKRDREWLYAFIRNSDSIINVAKDSIAVSVYKQYGEARMSLYPDLTNDEIDYILSYCDGAVMINKVVECY